MITRVVERHKEFNKRRLSLPQTRNIPVSVAMLGNPFLAGSREYQHLINQITEYNHRATQGLSTDSFEQFYYSNLASVLHELSFLHSGDLQITRLKQVISWAADQKLLLNQRKQQNLIRYKMIHRHSESFRESFADIHESKIDSEAKKSMYLPQIPTTVRAALLSPYEKGNRTIHDELEAPARRLSEYKRKIINIGPLLEPQEEQRKDRILYQRPPSIVPELVGQTEVVSGGEGHASTGGQQIKNPQEVRLKFSVNPENAVVGVEVGSGQLPSQQQVIDDFGAPPDEGVDEPEAAEEDEKKDKLAPLVKPYIHPFSSHSKPKSLVPLDRMYLKLKNVHERSIADQKEYSEAISTLQYWSCSKARYQRIQQNKLESSVLNPEYKLLGDREPEESRLSLDEQNKFGFTVPVKKNEKELHVDLVEVIPSGGKSFYPARSELRKEKLADLRKKFAKLLDLREVEQRETSPTMCQYSPKRRDLSEILREHSPQNQRLQELKNVEYLKEHFTKNKLPIPMKSLIRALVNPEEQQIVNISPPSKDLPKNPFWIEPSKKKKKKK